MTDQSPIAPAARHDGWTPERRVRFLDHLALDGSVRAACARVGMSREAAYRLRRREAAFARAWDAALALAREASAEVLANRAIEGVEEEVWHRGELVGTRRKYDSRLLLAHMARLDKLAEANPAAKEEAGRFDELLALVAGEEPPEVLLTDDIGLPKSRWESTQFAADRARQELHYEWVGGEEARAEKLDRLSLTPEQRIDAEIAEEMEHDSDCVAEAVRQGREAGLVWDQWRRQAMSCVDRLLGAPLAPEAVTASRTLSIVSTSPDWKGRLPG